MPVSPAMLRGQRQDRGAIGAGERARAQDDHRALGVLQHLGEGMAAVGDGFQHADIGAQLLDRIGEIDRRADIGDLQRAGQPRLADAGIQHRRIPARIGAHQQNGVGRFHARDGGVEQIGLARAACRSWRRPGGNPDSCTPSAVIRSFSALISSAAARSPTIAAILAGVVVRTLAAMAAKASAQLAGFSLPFTRT